MHSIRLNMLNLSNSTIHSWPDKCTSAGCPSYRPSSAWAPRTIGDIDYYTTEGVAEKVNSPSLSLEFCGSAAHVYFAIGDGIMNPVTACTVSLDGGPASHLLYNLSTNSTGFTSTLVYSVSGLRHDKHTITINSSTLFHDSVINFEHMIYTHEIVGFPSQDYTAIPNTLQSQTLSVPESSAIIPPKSPPEHKHILWIVSGLGITLTVAAAAVILIFLYRRHRAAGRKLSYSDQEAKPFFGFRSLSNDAHQTKVRSSLGSPESSPTSTNSNPLPEFKRVADTRHESSSSPCSLERNTHLMGEALINHNTPQSPVTARPPTRHRQSYQLRCTADEKLLTAFLWTWLRLDCQATLAGANITDNRDYGSCHQLPEVVGLVHQIVEMVEEVRNQSSPPDYEEDIASHGLPNTR